jgi:hypothetical protein
MKHGISDERDKYGTDRNSTVVFLRYPNNILARLPVCPHAGGGNDQWDAFFLASGSARCSGDRILIKALDHCNKI